MNARNAFLLLLLFLSQVHTAGNGVVGFSNLPSPPERCIYRGEWVLSNGQPEFFSWQPCWGNGYRVALYWGPGGMTQDSGMIQVGSSAPFLPVSAAGMFLGGNRTLTTPDPAPVLSFQIRAWEVGSANALTWDQAVQTHGVAGKGPIFELKTKDPADLTQQPPVVGQAPGFRGFIFGPNGVTTILVPEPRSLVLAILTLGCLLLRWFYCKARPRDPR